MEDKEFLLDIVYKNKTVKFRVVNPDAPLDYFFGKEDPVVHEIRVLRPRIGHTNQTLADYQIENGDMVYLVPDPFPG